MSKRGYRELLNATRLSKKMSRQEIQNYITKGTNEINKMMKTGVIRKQESLIKALNFISKDSSFKYVKGHKQLALKLSVPKIELLERAKKIRAFFEIDLYTKNKQAYLDELEEKAYNAFVKTVGRDVDKATYRRMVRIMGDLGSSILEQLGSDNFISLFNENKDLDSKSIAEIIEEVVENADGRTQSQLRDDVDKAMKDELNKMKG